MEKRTSGMKCSIFGPSPSSCLLVFFNNCSLSFCFWLSDSNLRLFVSRDGTTALSGIRLGNRWETWLLTFSAFCVTSSQLLSCLLRHSDSVAVCLTLQGVCWRLRTCGDREPLNRDQLQRGFWVLLVFLEPQLVWCCEGKTSSVCTLCEISFSLLVRTPFSCYCGRERLVHKTFLSALWCVYLLLCCNQKVLEGVKISDRPGRCTSDPSLSRQKTIWS